MSRSNLERKIRNYAKDKGRVTIPEIQIKFHLSYKDTASIVRCLCESKFMWLDKGLEYKVYESSYTWEERQLHVNKSFDAKKMYGNLLPLDKVANSITDYDEKERFVLKALAYCIARKEMTLIDLKNALSCSYTEAYRAVEWMLYNGFVESEEIDNQNYYKSIINKQKYAKRFGISVFDALCKD